MKATLYVKGVRTKFVSDASYQGYVMTSGPYGAQAREYPDYKVIIDTKYKSVLPEDQKAVVEIVKAAALRYGFELKVIDVAEKHFLRKPLDKSKGINAFPTLVTDDGSKIEGDITEEQVKALLRRQPYDGRQTAKDQMTRSSIVPIGRMRSTGWLGELRLERSVLWFCVGVFVLTAVGIDVLYYGIFGLPPLWSFFFLIAYIIAWVLLPAFTFDFSRDRFKSKRLLVLTLGVVLVSALFANLVWTVAGPSWSFSVSTDKSTYRLGELVTITASLRNEGLISHYFISVVSDPVLFRILGPDGNDWHGPYHENTTTFSLSASQTLERTFTWNQSYVPGTYRIRASIPDAEAALAPYGISPANPPLFLATTSINITSD